ILTRLAKLAPDARQLVRANAVLGTLATAAHLWQVSKLGAQDGVEALEEAIGRGLLVEEPAGGGHQGTYRLAHERMRDVIYTEIGAARRLVLHQRALMELANEGAEASELAYHALAAGEAEAASRYSLQAGDEAAGVFAVEDAIRHYERVQALLQEHKPL